MSHDRPPAPSPVDKDRKPFRLMRLDDNGGTFEMARFASREEADEAARVYEARGHKQTYWVEEDR
jgi:hypothetical protein